MNDKLVLYSNYNVEIAESEDKTYLDCTFVLCDFNPNKNGVKLDETESSKYLDTLLNMPIVGKVYEVDGEADFGSHEAKKTYELKNGELTSKLVFGTSAYGSFYKCFIDTIEDEQGNNVDVIKGSCKIWTRFSEVCNIILKRVKDGIPLATSWEIVINESHQELIDGKKIKVVTDFSFLSLAMLGRKVSPAYDCSGLLACASEEVDDLAIAMEQNKIEESIQSDNSVENKLNENEGGNIDMAEKKIKEEISSITTNDLYSKLSTAISTINPDCWINIARIYPYEFRALGYDYCCAESEDDYIEYKYVVNSDETISIISQSQVKMTFIPSTQMEAQMSELQAKADEANTSLSEKIDEILKLGETITSQKEEIASKNAIIAELEPIKQQVAEAEAKKREEEEIAKKDCMSEMLVSSKYFTKEEVEASEAIQEAIASLDEARVKVILAEKVVEVASKVVEEPVVVVSEKAEKEIEVSTDLNADQDYDYSKSGNVMLDVLQNKKKKRRR